ncbi:aldose epimerase family protein [Allofournierella sp.]|uniref:aldose epimerase family protein n=1 Tax=Allofournierella sp. TaxID=1940256 RepID=UPI003AB7B614
MAVKRELFGHTGAGAPVWRYTLYNETLAVAVLDRGVTLQSVTVPGREGPVDVLLGYDDVRSYEENGGYLGAFVGRVANRIAGGRFCLGGQEYALACNDGPNHLHGGREGFDKRLFTLAGEGPDHLVFVLESPAGEEGYPGAVRVEVCLRLVEDGFSMEWKGEAGQPTLFGPSCHAYWNLAGQGRGDVLDQRLRLFAAAYTPVDETLIPTGEVRPVAGTPFDFTAAKPLGREIAAPDPQLGFGGGYDHNFVLEGETGTPHPCAEGYSPVTGVRLRMETTLPGVQLYTGNYLSAARGKGGAAYSRHSGFCLEPQYFPDAVHHPGFEQNLLLPGAPQRHRTTWRFSVE